MEHYVYAIKNKTGRIYVGLSKNLKNRLNEHNKKRVFSTKGYAPWRLFYLQKCHNRIIARKEKKRLKSGYGKEFLKQISRGSSVVEQ
ncbi:GIY-YIG nuclease family protein [Patescibacteria group bacterium]|nr:GIY-YIG nuclease family protein [Patescibacteria group bacterium]